MKTFTRLFKFFIVLFMVNAFTTINVSAQKILIQEGFEEDSTGWQIVNNGANIWDVLTGGYNSYKGDRCMYVTTNDYGNPADCWLISTPVKFILGRKYSISFHYKCQVPQNNKLEVTLGRQNVNTSGQLIWQKLFNNDSYATGQINYTADETGTKYLRFHCTTPKMYTYLYFDSVTVKEVTCFQPQNIKFSNITSNSVTASWDKIEGADSYEYSVFNKDTSIPKYIHKTKDTFVNLTGLNAATTLYLYVRSKCSAKDSSDWAIGQFSTNYDCSTFPTVTCGTTVKQHYRGKTGIYQTDFCGQILSGPEYFHKFTPDHDGYYKLDCFSSGGNGIPVGFAYKESSLGCDNNNWNCIGVMFDYTYATFGPLKAGVEYTIIEKSDLQAGLPSSYIYKIECYTPPPVNDSCGKAIQIPVTSYSDSNTGTTLTTAGATPDVFDKDYRSCGSFDGTSSNDDDIWVKFKANNDNLIFRFTKVKYTGKNHSLVINFYSEQCNVKSKVDCGYKETLHGVNNDILSYYFEKGKVYYARISSYGMDNAATFNLSIMKPGIADNSKNTCGTGLVQATQSKDNGIWVPMLDSSLKLIAAVKFNNGQTKSLTPSLFVNHGDLRVDAAGNYYLDRNISILPQKNVSSSFTVRLYFTKDELRKLMKQPGSNVSSLNDINVTQSDAGCTSFYKKQGTFIMPTARGNYDSVTRYVEFTTDHLSSFFLHGGNEALVAGSGFAQSDASAKSLIKNTINVSPNPFINQLNIETNELSSTQYKISITTVDGKPVASFERTVNAGYNKLSLDLSRLTKGVYLLKMEKQNNVVVKKIIKQ